MKYESPTTWFISYEKGSKRLNFLSNDDDNNNNNKDAAANTEYSN